MDYHSIKSKYKHSEYFYIIRSTEFIGNNVYKIGKTAQKPFKRFNSYPLNSELYLCLKVEDSDLFETEIVKLFNLKFKLFQGREYYFGNVHDMITEAMNLYFKLNNSQAGLGLITEIKSNKPIVAKPNIATTKIINIDNIYDDYSHEIDECSFINISSQTLINFSQPFISHAQIIELIQTNYDLINKKQYNLIKQYNFNKTYNEFIKINPQKNIVWASNYLYNYDLNELIHLNNSFK